jgi:glycosyltransferase involved in cell wall biosynthesis
MKKDIIDILVPVFNSSEGLERTLSSISISPAVNMFNVIVIDNNSDENLKSICDKYEFALEYHKNKENIGRIPNWNKGLQFVSNDWFMFLFAGDEIDPSIDFNLLINLLHDSNHVIFPFNLRGKNSFSFVNKWGFKNIRKNVESYLFKFLLSCRMPWGPLQCHLFKSDSSKKRFKENNPTHGDIEFIFSVLKECKNVSFYPNSIFTWVWNESRFHNQIDLLLSVKKDLKFTYEKLDLFSANYSKFKLKIIMSCRVLMFFRHYSLFTIVRAIFGIIFYKVRND